MEDAEKALFLHAAEQIHIDTDPQTLAAMEGFLARAKALLAFDTEELPKTERICAPLCARADTAAFCLGTDNLARNGRFAEGFYSVQSVLAPKKPYPPEKEQEADSDADL